MQKRRLKNQPVAEHTLNTKPVPCQSDSPTETPPKVLPALLIAIAAGNINSQIVLPMQRMDTPVAPDRLNTNLFSNIPEIKAVNSLIFESTANHSCCILQLRTNII